MRFQGPFRFAAVATLALSAAAPCAFARGAARQTGAEARGARPGVRPGVRAPARPAANPNQEHLQQWLQRHQGLSVPEQLRQLQSEPGFNELPPEVQQRYRDRLIQLNTMAPEQRDRLLQRNEALERLSLPERQEYRVAVQRFAASPPDRRRLMAKAVVDLRAMPPDQRQIVLNSDRFRAEFSDPERATLNSLLSVEPYTGPPPVR